MAQHKHHDLIVAWAKGARIQVLAAQRGWIDCQEQCSPAWDEDCYYRIKPEPKPNITKLVYVNPCGYVWNEGSGVWEHKPKNLRLVLDGETGVLKSAEVINDR